MIDLLTLPDLGPDQNFFDAGGTSLLALQVLPGMSKAIDFEFKPIDIFRFPSIQRLAAHASTKLHGDRPGGHFNRGEMRRQLTARRLGKHAG